MSQLCIHTQLKVIFAHLSTFKYWKKVNTMYQYMYLNPNTTLIKTPHPRWGSSKRYYYTRYHSCTGSHTILPISIGMSWMIEPLFESIRSDDSIHPWLADMSCDQPAIHARYWMFGIHREIPASLISPSGEEWIDPALGVLVVIHMSKRSGRVLILTSD